MHLCQYMSSNWASNQRGIWGCPLIEDETRTIALIICYVINGWNAPTYNAQSLHWIICLWVRDVLCSHRVGQLLVVYSCLALWTISVVDALMAQKLHIIIFLAACSRAAVWTRSRRCVRTWRRPSTRPSRTRSTPWRETVNPSPASSMRNWNRTGRKNV